MSAFLLSHCLSDDCRGFAGGPRSHADPCFVCICRGKADSQFLKLPKTLMMSTTERQCFEHEYYAKRNPVSAVQAFWCIIELTDIRCMNAFRLHDRAVPDCGAGWQNCVYVHMTNVA